jgi:hypothetical protein
MIKTIELHYEQDYTTHIGGLFLDNSYIGSVFVRKVQSNYNSEYFVYELQTIGYSFPDKVCFPSLSAMEETVSTYIRRKK